MLVVPYLLGGINTSIIVTKIKTGKDIRTMGSSNAGLTNMLRVFGKKAAVLTLLGDILKTVIPVLLAGIAFGFYYVSGIAIGYSCYVAGLFCVIGHIKPIYYGFRGGKGVLSAATVILMLSPAVFLVLLITFVLLVWMTRYVSLGSLVAAGLLPVALQGYMQIITNENYDGFILLIGFLLAAIIIICHRENIGRLWRHEENKISFHSDKNDDGGKK
jgi:glycerol-3-phosphate acyltransferase PlsY